MGYHDNSFARSYQVVEKADNHIRRFGVEIAGGFVRGDNGWIGGQSSGDGGALLLPGGDCQRQFVGLFSSPTIVSNSRARLGRSSKSYLLTKSMGSMTFSCSVSMGNSWKN